MRVTLEATAGPAAGRKILLRSQQSARIGRTQVADYAFDDAYLSGVHFSVSFDGRECRLRDLGSSNGTFVNGQQVMEATLNSGDEIGAGACRFCVKIDETVPYRQPAGFPAVADRSQAIATAKAAQDARSAEAVRPVVSKATPQFVQARTQPIPTRPGVEAPQRWVRGLADEDPEVRQTALFAAAWTRQAWLMRHLVRLAADPALEDLPALRVFAVLAEASQLSAIRSAVRNPKLGPDRLQITGVFGHPGLVQDLLTAMSWEDEAAVYAARDAFERITGAEITAAEAQDDNAPAAAAIAVAARDFWRREEPRFASGTRWSRGREVSRPLPDEALRELDLQTRWEVLLRDHFYRRRQMSIQALQLLKPLV